MRTIENSPYREHTPPSSLADLPFEADTVQDRGESLVIVAVSGLGSDANEIVQPFGPQNGDDPIRFQTSGGRVVGQISGKTRLAVQTHTFALPLDFHFGIRFLQIL